MKKVLCVCFSALLIALTACSAEFDIQAASDAYFNAQTITCDADIETKDDLVFTYNVTCSFEGEKSSILINAPESISGIRADIEGDSAKLIFDTASVDTLMRSIKGYTPLDAIHCIVSDIKNVVPTNYSFDELDGTDVLIYTYATETEEKKIYMKRDDFALLKAEFFVDGKLIMDLKVTSFQMY